MYLSAYTTNANGLNSLLILFLSAARPPCAYVSLPRLTRTNGHTTREESAEAAKGKGMV